MTTALMIASVALGGISSLAGGAADAQAYRYREAVAKRNAVIAEQNAGRAINKSQIDAQDQDAMTLAALGQLSAEQGASGISFNSKSFTRGRKTVMTLGRKDALNTRYAGEVAAQNYRTDAQNFQSEAKLDSMGASSSLLKGWLGAADSLISGASKISRFRRLQITGGSDSGSLVS